MKTLIILLGVVLSSIVVCQESYSSPYECGFTLGWGAPYGESFEVSKYLTDAHSLNFGVGMSMSGFKSGLGYKLIFKPENKFSPFFGVNLAYSTGINKLNVNVNTDTAVYKISSGVLLSPRAGLKFQATGASIYFNLGAGIPFGGKSEYVSGSNAHGVESLAKAMSLGGIEASVTVMFGRLRKSGIEAQAE